MSIKIFTEIILVQHDEYFGELGEGVSKTGSKRSVELDKNRRDEGERRNKVQALSKWRTSTLHRTEERPQDV